jgi:urease accessory protein
MRTLIALLLALAAFPALAHPGHGAEAFGFLSGFAHPFTGLDHLLAMLAVGLWSATTAKETLIKSPVRPELVEGHKPEALNIGVLIGVWFDRLTTNGLNKCFPKRIWLVPLSFACTLFIGALLAANGFFLPAVEPMIAASVLVLGLLIIARVHLPESISALLVGGFAFFHGAAHGVELGESVALVGMVIATAMLHSAGIGAGLLLKAHSLWWQRVVGGGIALTGANLALNLI